VSNAVLQAGESREPEIGELLSELRSGAWELAVGAGGSLVRPTGGWVGGQASAAEIARWLSAYRDETVVRQEWPVVAEAWRLAASGQFQDLLALDVAWGQRFGAEASASWRVGQRQLGRLRPLRDARVVQRYLEAVAEGRARGWHPVVFGVWLAVFGVPLRQGLLHYAEQTLVGLLDSVPAPVGWSERARTELGAGLVAVLPERLARLIPADPARLRIVR
jgi:hypothetical protein